MPSKITLQAITLLIFELQTSRLVQFDQHGALVPPVATRAEDASRFGTRPVWDASYPGRVRYRTRPELESIGKTKLAAKTLRRIYPPRILPQEDLRNAGGVPPTNQHASTWTSESHTQT